MSSFNSTANLLLEHLGTMAEGKTEVCMYDQFARAALDVICKVKSKYLRIKDNQFGKCCRYTPNTKYTVLLEYCASLWVFNRWALE